MAVGDRLEHDDGGDDFPREHGDETAQGAERIDIGDDDSGQNSSGSSEQRIRSFHQNDAIDAKYGFERFQEGPPKTGWLINVHPIEVVNDERKLVSAVDYYFMQEDGTRFKATIAYKPYFYILPRKGFEKEVELFLQKKFVGYLSSTEFVSKEDLDLPNHLVGLKQRLLKLSFMNVTDLLKVRKDILPSIRKNKSRDKTNTLYSEILKQTYMGETINNLQFRCDVKDHLENIIDIREYDVPYHVRVSIDKNIFVGSWYLVSVKPGEYFDASITKMTGIMENPDCIVLAYDIETTKLPLKFPDSSFDQIMMISYMIDGQGFLITNREVVSDDVDDFEYSPKPEMEGLFTVFNERNEKELIQRFFDHILEIKPHIFVTYNGDFFDWPFVEARAKFYGISMKSEIGFSRNVNDFYSCRPCIHMDCLNWVKRDSYLPVGSHNLKAVTKAKLRYDPVELDPEEMCKMAAEQPQVLADYSVSDAVATYYLYMKYVHPFIFALCTIIPMEAEQVLRKGSGTLCETLLMVQAYEVNIVFPNKQESTLNKLTEDGHVLHQETYVGGHVEALESGVFRADIQYRFKLNPDIFDTLIKGVEKTLKHAIQEEEKILIEDVLNLNEVAESIKEKLRNLRDHPMRNEFPLIYHLDVGAMYPNIILTNRLQPSAMVDETVCAACDFNKPGASCQKSMQWTWRGDYMPATRSEFQRIKQQLETERFPPAVPNGPFRAFHQMSKEECAAIEKKRLTEYCRKAYKKVRVTKTEIREQTVCQKENSFYVDTVRAFRDRRYEYKAMNKQAKKQVAIAVASGDASEIKSAKNREVLFDSLQLAHKCILNSFYGYVMRRGARWHSMEMGGLVCHTGANIIRKAREIIEKVGRPLELDTDGIWCMLPSSFPDNFDIITKLEKKPKVTISYSNAVLNMMVKDEFTNNQYHELLDSNTLQYSVRSENSIFFEVDGPYLAMILPAAKEEGKKLKKRYAVFNMDKSLAELKGFEVKRRGELRLIKNFQSSVFESFLGGNSLENCYKSVAKVADYWLDVLFSKAVDLPDSDLFELISENRSMSRKLEDYGSQKSTSISTAKRLAEFLGDQMVKDAGLSCRFVISKKPDGAPVTERAIPLAIFQAEPSVKKYYLRKWLKDNSIVDFDIRTILDWDYYIERLGGTIQKIVTIPAALQGVPNPVPRVSHPDWLHRKMLEKTDVLKQRKINEIFKSVDKSNLPSKSVVDIEDIASIRSGSGQSIATEKRVVVRRKGKRGRSPEIDCNKNWREALGEPPSMGDTKESINKWLIFHKKKWNYLKKQKSQKAKRSRLTDSSETDFELSMLSASRTTLQKSVSLTGFLKRAQQVLLDTPWQILQLTETGHPGRFKLWVMVGLELHLIKLIVPRIFYLNSKEAKARDEGDPYRKISKLLPRAHQAYHLYEYSIPEEVFMEASNNIIKDLASPSVEGIYETQVPLDFRVIAMLGSVCSVDRQASRKMREVTDTFELSQLNFQNISKEFPYLDLNIVKYIFLYHHKSGNKSMVGLFFPMTEKASIFAVDTVKTNQMPNMTNLYRAARNDRISKENSEDNIPGPDIKFEVNLMTEMRAVHIRLQKLLQTYKDEKRGPTIIAVQSVVDFSMWTSAVPVMGDFPLVPVHVQDFDDLYNALDWQRIGSRMMIRHFLRSKKVLLASINQSRYFHVPIGNIPPDSTLYGSDVMFSRRLIRHNYVLWCSKTERPDLGGKEADDNRLVTEFDEHNSVIINQAGCYQTVCVELELEGLAVNTILQAHLINDIEGTSSCVAFDTLPQASLEEMMGNTPGTALASYDETALCSGAFRIMKSLVSSWLKDVTVNLSYVADFQLVNFYRWIRSKNSLLYDPALRKTLSNLMKKLYVQLIAEFMRLGSAIVFANFSRIIICTRKSRVNDALGYMQYVLATIRNRELFNTIDLKIVHCWEYLMWLDTANYGGIVGNQNKDKPNPNASTTADSSGSDKKKQDSRKKRKQTTEKPGTSAQSNGEMNQDSMSDNGENESPPVEIESSDDEEECNLNMNWSLVNYLPRSGNCSSHFKTIIASYISAIHKSIKSEMESFVPGETPVRKRTLTQTPRRVGNNVAASNTIEFSRKLVEGELSQLLFQIISQIDKKFPQCRKELESKSMQVMRSVENPMQKPALELVKAVHKVLSLDANINEEVEKLRRSLLKLINVGEFGQEAKWVDPVQSIILPEVICKVCNQCRDIDLTKDHYVSYEKELPVWLCPSCQTNYETEEMELLLLDIVNRKLMGYFLQDLQCLKCHEVKQANIQKMCECGGKFVALMSAEATSAKLRAFKEIATRFGMPLLLQNVDWALKMNTR